MHVSPITSILLFAFLVSGFSVGLEAQEPEAESKKSPVSSAVEKADGAFKPEAIEQILKSTLSVRCIAWHRL